MIYALDSNIISYILKQDEGIINRYREEAFRGSEFIMPPVVYFEVKRWLLERGAKKKEAEFVRLCEAIPLGELDRRAWDIAAALYVSTRKSGNPIDDADLIIAAFCMAGGYTLVTNNARHFERLEGMRFVNWKNRLDYPNTPQGRGG